MRVCLCAHARVCVCVFVRVCMCVYVRVFVHASLCVYIHARVTSTSTILACLQHRQAEIPYARTHDACTPPHQSQHTYRNFLAPLQVKKHQSQHTYRNLLAPLQVKKLQRQQQLDQCVLQASDEERATPAQAGGQVCVCVCVFVCVCVCASACVSACSCAGMCTALVYQQNTAFPDLSCRG